MTVSGRKVGVIHSQLTEVTQYYRTRLIVPPVHCGTRLRELNSVQMRETHAYGPVGWQARRRI